MAREVTSHARSQRSCGYAALALPVHQWCVLSTSLVKLRGKSKEVSQKEREEKGKELKLFNWRTVSELMAWESSKCLRCLTLLTLTLFPVADDFLNVSHEGWNSFVQLCRPEVVLFIYIFPAKLVSVNSKTILRKIFLPNQY